MRPHSSIPRILLMFTALWLLATGCTDDPDLDDYTFNDESDSSSQVPDGSTPSDTVGGDVISSDSSEPDADDADDADTEGDATSPDSVTDTVDPDALDADTEDVPSCVSDCVAGSCGSIDNCGQLCGCETDELCHPSGTCVDQGAVEVVAQWETETIANDVKTMVSTPHAIAWVTPSHTYLMPHDAAKGTICSTKESCTGFIDTKAHMTAVPLLGTPASPPTATLTHAGDTVVVWLTWYGDGEEQASMFSYAPGATTYDVAKVATFIADPSLTDYDAQRTLVGTADHLWWAWSSYSDSTSTATGWITRAPADIDGMDPMSYLEISESTWNEETQKTDYTGCHVSKPLFATTEHLWLPCRAVDGWGLSSELEGVEVHKVSDFGAPGSFLDMITPAEFISDIKADETIALLDMTEDAVFFLLMDSNCEGTSCTKEIHRKALEWNQGMAQLSGPLEPAATLELSSSADVMVPFAHHQTFGYLSHTAYESQPVTTLYPVVFDAAESPALEPLTLDAGLNVNSVALSPDGRFLYWAGITEPVGAGGPGAPGEAGYTMGVYRTLIQ